AARAKAVLRRPEPGKGQGRACQAGKGIPGGEQEDVRDPRQAAAGVRESRLGLAVSPQAVRIEPPRRQERLKSLGVLAVRYFARHTPPPRLPVRMRYNGPPPVMYNAFRSSSPNAQFVTSSVGTGRKASSFPSGLSTYTPPLWSSAGSNGGFGLFNPAATYS